MPCANLVSPTLVGMSAPARTPSTAAASPHLTLVAVPPGSSGAGVAREVIERILESSGSAFALVGDPISARTVLEPDRPLEDPRTALVLMTSGSTGDPKGVCWSASNILAMSAMWRVHYPELLSAPRIVALPVTSAGGLGVIARAAIDQAPTVVLESLGGASRFSAQIFADAVRPVADAGPVVSLVPTQVALLLREETGRAALRAMRKVFIGGAAAPPRLIAQTRDLGIDVVTTYGMTETCGGCVHDGQALDGVSVRVDESGRIHLSGATVALGYRLRPGDTAAVFTGDTFHTGDIGSWDGHQLRVIGRVDDIVQIRGVNVAIGAVERAIADSGHALDVVVIPIADDVDGTALHALVIPDRQLSHDDLETWSGGIAQSIRSSLGGIAVPRTIQPVAVLPYLPGGKLDRRAARSLLIGDSSHRQDSTLTPTTDSEGT